MISDFLYKICCDDISLIENYKEAINDEKMWECHHRLETDLDVSRQYLINNNLYFNRPASELIFLTRSEHNKIHKLNSHLAEETKKKISESHKGKIASNETRNKMSESHKGKKPALGHKCSDETKKILSEKSKGENNGMYGKTSPLKGKRWKLVNGKREYYTN